MAEDSEEKDAVGKDAANEQQDKEEQSKDSEEPTEPEGPKELEEDAPVDKGPTIQTAVTFPTEDLTVNCMPSIFGNMLSSLSDGGLQYLLAGARANTGLKSGRYMFEVKILEFSNPQEDSSARNKTPLPRNQLRMGFSTANSSLFLGETEDAVCFTADGAMMHNKTKKPLGLRLQTGDVAGVLLNLDESSPNVNTISLFKNGVRACQPQALPEALQGKALYPTVTFKNITLHYNFGPAPIASLPFRCNMVQDASETDVVIQAAAKQMKDGRNEVIFPVCLPDEGTFDWLDMFIEKNRNFTELSDRTILDWAEKSGLRRIRAPGSGPTGAAPELVGQRNSNDKPEMGFGITMMDDGSVRRVLHSIAPLQQRNYVVMEVKSNLLQRERKDMVAKWATSGFKRTAAVMMGEPPQPLKKRCQELTLKAKQEVADAEFKVRKAEEKRKKIIAQKQKRLEKEKRRASKAAKKKQEMLKKKFEEEKRKKERAEKVAKGEEVEEEAEEAPQEEAKEEEKDSDEDEKTEEEPEEPEEEPPKAELTAEEKKQWFRQTSVPDLSAYALGTTFMKFTIPDKEEEAFDEVRYDWAKGEKCKEYLRQWIRDRKLTIRVEDLQPSEWFNTKWKEWQKTLQVWHSKQNQYKAAMTKKAANDNAKLAAKEAKKKEAAEKAAAAAKAKEAKEKAEAEKAQKEGQGDGDAEKAQEKEEAQDVTMEASPAEEEEKEETEDPAVDFEKLDVFGVEDILDVGGGQPIFSAFTFEDWTMVSLRFELYLLTHAFRKDVNDPDRLGVHVEHLAFYYNKYFKKALNLKFYGVETIKELLEYVRDTVVIRSKSQVIEPNLPEEMESWGIFAMLTEESRRDRMRRIDLGDETAKLALSQQPGVVSGTQPAARVAQASGGASWPSGGGGGAGGWKAQNNAWGANGGNTGGWPQWAPSQNWRSWY